MKTAMQIVKMVTLNHLLNMYAAAVRKATERTAAAGHQRIASPRRRQGKEWWLCECVCVYVYVYMPF